MKAFLLAAGKGTRMRPLTDTTPKCLLPVRGVPMLKIWMELCRRHGIREILVNLHAHAQAVREFLRSNGDGLRVDISEEPALLGSAGTLRANRDWVSAEPFFWVFYADVLTRADLGRMLRFHLEHRQAATLGVYAVPDPSRCGVVVPDEYDMVREFVEKPSVPVGNLAFAGVMLAGPELLDAVPDKIPCDLGFDVLPQLVGRMAAYPISEYLLDIGTPENYRAAQQGWRGQP